MAAQTNVMAVVDFETTGLSPQQGARAIEIAVVLVAEGRVVDSFSSLMNPGVFVPYEITQLTGITSGMVKSAPPSRTVMQDAAQFIGGADLVAHNAAFDRGFLESEYKAIGVSRPLSFICTMLLSRRLFRDAPNHKLGTLIHHLKLPTNGKLHRALADARVTAELLFHIQSTVETRYGLTLPHSALARVQKTSHGNLEKVMHAFKKAASPSGRES